MSQIEFVCCPDVTLQVTTLHTNFKILQAHLINVFLEVHQNRKPAGSIAGWLVERLEVLFFREMVTL